jgi:hypothetical protein
VRDERGSWYLLTGLVLGLAFGLVFAWVITPQAHGDTSPAYLRADFKDRYRAMIALAFSANRNLPRAQARLNLLGDSDIALAVAEQARRAGVGGGSLDEVRALEFLSQALEGGATPRPSTQASSVTPPSAPANSSPPAPLASPQASLASATAAAGNSPTDTLVSISTPVTGAQGSGAAGPGTSTHTPLAARTPTPTSVTQFVLEENNFVCDQDLGQPLIQVLARDASGDPAPGVEVWVVWEGGEDHFFTGLKPDMGAGYADFVMSPGTVYTLQLATGGPPVPDLEAAECEGEDGAHFWGSRFLVFTRP